MEEWLESKISFHFENNMEEDEVFIIICLAEPLKYEYGEDLNPQLRGNEYWCLLGSGETYIEFGNGCRIIEKCFYNNDEYVIISCTTGVSLSIQGKFKYKGISKGLCITTFCGGCVVKI